MLILKETKSLEGFTGHYHDDVIKSCAERTRDHYDNAYYYAWKSGTLERGCENYFEKGVKLIKIGFTGLNEYDEFERYDSDMRELKRFCVSKGFLNLRRELKTYNHDSFIVAVNSINNKQRIIECINDNVKPIDLIRCKIPMFVKRAIPDPKKGPYYRKPNEICMDMCFAKIVTNHNIINVRSFTFVNNFKNIETDFCPNLFIPWLKSGHTEFFNYNGGYGDLLPKFHSECGYQCVQCHFDFSGNNLFSRIQCDKDDIEMSSVKR